MRITRFGRLSLCTLVLAATGCLVPLPRRAVVVVGPPPAEVVETIPAQPGPDYVWIRGHYRWDGAQYVWMPGHWAQPPAGYVEWVPGHWVRREGGWFWIEGHWR